jgi:hypothetical protein
MCLAVAFYQVYIPEFPKQWTIEKILFVPRVLMVVVAALA